MFDAMSYLRFNAKKASQVRDTLYKPHSLIIATKHVTEPINNACHSCTHLSALHRLLIRLTAK